MLPGTTTRNTQLRASVLVAEACRFYGWTVEYALAMPAVTFFVMVEAMRTLDAYEKMEACDIAAIPMCSAEWYEKVRGRYSGFIERQSLPPEFFTAPEQNKVKRDKSGLDGDEAKEFMMGLFARKKVYG